MESLYDQPNDGLRPISEVTMRYALKMLDKTQVYLEEIGDKLIKFSVQLVIRNLNFVLDKVSEKKTMATDRLLFILEDLNKLQTAVTEVLLPTIGERIRETLDFEIRSEVDIKCYLDPLRHELKLRFDHLVEPCLISLSSKISQRLIDNMSAFKQIPS